MRTARLKRFDGRVDSVKCYTASEYDWLSINEKKLGSRKRKGPRYFEAFASFDIETTTIIPEGDKSPYGYMYHWQMMIDGVVVYGRRWDDWINLLGKITDWLGADKNNRFVVYVHNLGFEMQFIVKFLQKNFGNVEVFATKPRKPIKLICDNGLEFRCSYFLTNMSLVKACENEKGVIHPKADGDLDYKQVRTADTELTDTEFGYCIADVVCLYELIQNRLVNEGDTLDSIPMTSTGYVRRDCRQSTRKDPNYRKYFLNNRMTPTIYQLLKETGRGGNTHANRFMSGRTWEKVDSYDVVSSYPSQLLLRDFPCRKFAYYGRVESKDELEQLTTTRPCLFRIVFQDLKIRPRVPMPYIPTAKALKHSKYIKCDNGRVLSADFIQLTLTDIDYQIIKSEYTWTHIYISDFYVSKYAPLPDALKSQVKHYFDLKTELKDKIKHAETDEERADLEYLYAKSKNRLNGIFGMAYTDPVRENIDYTEDGDWYVFNSDIAESLDKFYKNYNSFMSYAVGVWTTAWARLTLENLIRATSIRGNKCIYCDTDSSKAIIVDDSEVNRLNQEIINECELKHAYCDVNGTRYYIGTYEKETNDPYQYFKTLGAKKYVYQDQSGLHVTISGVNKKTGARELNSIENFKVGFIFKASGGSTLYYNDEPIHFIEVDRCKMLTASNIGMIDSTYQIGITGEYAELIGVNLYEEQ